MVDYNLSYSDLALVDNFVDIMLDDYMGQSFLNCLHDNGMNLNYEIDLHVCRHRNLRGDIVYCPRWEGQERLDKAWIKSGAASMNAIIFSTKDESLWIELSNMSKQIANDRTWENYKCQE